MVDESDPAAVADAAATFREEHADGGAALETLLAVDDEHDTWTFDDLPLDSGTFGELVSRGIVTNVDDGYRVSSREGVQAALEGRAISDADRSRSGFAFSNPIAFDVRAAAALVGALGLLVLMRIPHYRSVFRGERVVSPANDPYYYRYWNEHLLAESAGLTDWRVITQLPERAATRRPLTHATNWFVGEALGGDQWAAEMVAAWLPPVATVALGIVVYWLAVTVTDDVRVGIASVVLLAITPVHAVYTSAGFLEHRLHQYFWLGVTMLALAWLAVDLRQRRTHGSPVRGACRRHLLSLSTWLAAIALGVSLGLSIHAWGGSILLLVPVSASVGLKIVADARAGLSPVLANIPILVGLGLAGLLAAFLHLRWGWHEPFVAVVPVLVAAGAVLVVGLGELWRRLEWPLFGLVALEAIVASAGLFAFRRLRPEDWARIHERSDDLFFREHLGATEIQSLFALENSIVFGPLSQFGLWFYLALPVLGWGCWTAYRRYRPGWLVLSVYAGFWLVMAAFQGRFAGQLTIPFAVLGGFGLVWLLAWVDVARAPAPLRSREESGTRGRRPPRGTAADGGERRPSIVVPRDPKTLLALVWVVLLICALSLFLVPSMIGQATHSDAQFEAAMAIDEHAQDVGREYPDNFVLSEWGDNRMYNYFVNGESSRYGYAAQHFESFVTGDDPDGWYGEFNESDVGYVVLTDVGGDPPARSTQARLHEGLGTGGASGEPLEHYRAIYVGADATAFAVVPGATITGSGEPGETVSVETRVTVSDRQIAYGRDVTVDEDGTFEATVPYPGTYTVRGEAVTVPHAAVENGETVTLE